MLTHIYLSPHLDDAVLSCGGAIHHQTYTGEQVIVVTLCAGDPPPGPLSEFARTLHQRWSQGESPGQGIPFGEHVPARTVANRRVEDLAALNVLGAEGIHLQTPDCIYRTDPVSGEHLYASEEALFGALHPSESVLAEHLAQEISGRLSRFPHSRLYAPLGLGHHVDHQLARRAAELAGSVYAYFEDYPYAARETDPSSPSTDQEAALKRTAQGHELSPEIVPLSGASLSAKIRAIAAYGSQISSFWEDVAAMETAVRQFAERTGGGSPAERLWRVW